MFSTHLKQCAIAKPDRNSGGAVNCPRAHAAGDPRPARRRTRPDQTAHSTMHWITAQENCLWKIQGVCADVADLGGPDTSQLTLIRVHSRSPPRMMARYSPL